MILTVVTMILMTVTAIPTIPTIVSDIISGLSLYFPLVPPPKILEALGMYSGERRTAYRF